MIVDETLQTTRNDDGAIQEKWNALKSALCDGAEANLRHSKRRQPDWLHDSSAK